MQKNSMQLEHIHSMDDVLHMLDSLFRNEGDWWDSFYADRSRNIPFFHNAPDENLVEYFEQAIIQPGHVLELGCGAGRNALYMAGRGCRVDAIDISQEAIAWGIERTRESHAAVSFHCTSLFDYSAEAESYDIIYDSGCFHHLYPHRRISYLEFVNQALKPGGVFGLVCFSLGDMGAELSDWEVYRQRSMRGGLGYTEEKLKAIFHGFEMLDFRKMRQMTQPGPLFGEAFLWTALFRKEASPLP